jgi:hypothetical protein
MLLAALLHDAGAQSPATVVITAPRPVDLKAYRATEARLKSLLSHQPSLSSPFLSGCMENRFAQENASFPGGALPLQDSNALANHIKCGRAHIEAKDTTLRQGLDAFDKHDYAAALAFFQEAYTRMGTLDAALMLAKMHLDGLGTPKDRVQGIKWLHETAEARFDPWHDRLRFDPANPQATNARIEAALMLARLYELGEGAAPDREEAAAWYAKAEEFGFVPAAVIPKELAAAHEPVMAAVGQGHPDAAPGLRTMQDTITIAPVEHPPVEATSRSPQHRAETLAGTVVRVTGLRAIPWKSYRAMRAAVAAFEKYKSLAPDAVFSFAVLPPVGKTLPSNFALRVRTRDGKEFPVPLESGELFQLPVLPDPEVDADLVSNLKEGQLRIGLLVHTPTVPPDKERLGDVRLRSEISQAIADVDHPGDDPGCLRKTLLLPRRCRPAHVTVWFKPRAPAGGAWLVEGNRREALAANGDPDYPSFRMPVNAGHLGNDALIEFDYKHPLGAVKYSAVAIYDAND